MVNFNIVNFITIGLIVIGSIVAIRFAAKAAGKGSPV